MDHETRFARDALKEMGSLALEALLRAAPPTNDPEVLRSRHACWAQLARRAAVPGA
jgi:hypothetical protein